MFLAFLAVTAAIIHQNHHPPPPGAPALHPDRRPKPKGRESLLAWVHRPSRYHARAMWAFGKMRVVKLAEFYVQTCRIHDVPHGQLVKHTGSIVLHACSEHLTYHQSSVHVAKSGLSKNIIESRESASLTCLAAASPASHTQSRSVEATPSA
jgi:hypothetical protein